MLKNSMVGIKKMLRSAVALRISMVEIYDRFAMT